MFQSYKCKNLHQICPRRQISLEELSSDELCHLVTNFELSKSFCLLQRRGSSQNISKSDSVLFCAALYLHFLPLQEKRDAAYDYLKYWITEKGCFIKPGATHNLDQKSFSPNPIRTFEKVGKLIFYQIAMAGEVGSPRTFRCSLIYSLLYQ